jgi:hypothetical protein
MKGQVMADINSQLSELGMMPTFGKGTDIMITTEFNSTNGRNGSKILVYEASIYLDQQQKTAYMYEKTSESMNRLPLNTSMPLFQSGLGMRRNESHVRYRLDGTVYEVEWDMGAVAKAVKQSVKSNGWKFKAVSKKSQAQYPSIEKSETESQPVGESTAPYKASVPYPTQPTQSIYTAPAKFSTAFQTSLFAGPYPAFTSVHSPRYFDYPGTSLHMDMVRPDALSHGISTVNRAGLIMLGILTILAMILYIVLGTQAIGFFFGSITLVVAGFFLKNRNRSFFSNAIMLLLTTVVLYAILISTTIL